MSGRTWAALVMTAALGVACDGGKNDDTAEDTAEDTGASGQPATVAQVCTKVFECGGYGWPDQATCEDGWIDNPDYGTQCVSSADYFACVADCLSKDCSGFATCESECWSSGCG